MCTPRSTWLKDARNSGSIRQIFALADDILHSEDATIKHRRAARQVVEVLESVIDKPIAEAARLAKARRRFENLKRTLERS